MTRSRRVAGVLVALFLALHLPYLPASLEDLDSINFALGVREFDVSRHQPHPPGYPVFIAAAKIARVLTRSETAALSIVGIVAGSLSVLALIALFKRIDTDPQGDGQPILAAILTVTAPLYWFTAARPLSDMAGLAAAVGIQAAVLSATTAGGLLASAFLTGLATGIRSQVAWLAVPCLAYAIWRMHGVGRGQLAVGALLASFVGALLWAVPLLWLTGGPSAYWRVLFNQGAEDLSGVTMLWTTPTVRELARALYYAFVAPWGPLPLAVAALTLAAAGCVRIGLRARSALVGLVVLFGPYLIFDMLFQETVTTRYALPLVVPMAYLAVRGADWLPWRLGGTAVAVLSLACVVAAERSLAGYAATPAPAFRLLADMSAPAAATSSPPVLAMHRREDFDLRRPVVWAGNRLPDFRERLATTPKHEWLEVVKYWNRGGRDTVWFLADPLRSDLELFQHAAPKGVYRWSFAELGLIGGVRPSEMDWYVIDPPAWYLGDGWAVTPETAGVAREDRRSPGQAPIDAWIRRRTSPVTVLVGGRNLSDGGPTAAVHIAIDDREIDRLAVRPGFFMKLLTVPAEALAGSGDYATLSIRSETTPGAGATPGAAANVAIEQFDAEPAGNVVFGFGEGWHEQEYNPASGKLWRWTSERAILHIRSAPRPLVLTLNGETETFPRPSQMIIRAGDDVLARQAAGSSFSITVPLPPALFESGEAALTIETDQTYVPAERGWRRLPDRRRLGLKIYECRITTPAN